MVLFLQLNEECFYNSYKINCFKKCLLKIFYVIILAAMVPWRPKTLLNLGELGPIFLGTPWSPDNQRPQALDRQFTIKQVNVRGTDPPQEEPMAP